MANCNLRHCRKLGWCIPAVKKFCSAQNIDWVRLKKGIPSEELRTYNIPEATKLANLAEAEEAQNGK